LGFLASHRGSSLEAVVEACAAGRLAADPKVVISNNADAEALARARWLGMPCCHLSGTTIPTPPASTPRSATRWPPMTREGVDTATVQALYADWQQAAFALGDPIPAVVLDDLHKKYEGKLGKAVARRGCAPGTTPRFCRRDRGGGTGSG
jgi:hypothetical protein